VWKDRHLYDEHDRDILNTIASQAAITIEKTRLFMETQEALGEGPLPG